MPALGGILSTTTVFTSADGQPLDSTLTALAAYNTNGLVTQTAADTFVGRTLTGTAGQISIANGDGVAGNPTVSLPATITQATVFSSTLAASGVFTAAATGKTAITISDSGAQVSGLTIGGDTNLYRSAANILKTDDALVVSGLLSVGGASAATDAITVNITGAGNYNLVINSDGKMEWSDGAGALDTTLYRFSSGILITDGFLAAVSGIYVDLGGTGSKIFFGSSADTNLYRLGADILKTDDSFALNGNIYADNADAGSKLYFGASIDTNLYRLGANILKTDDNFALNGDIYADNADAGSKLYFGTVIDTNLYRSAANTLKTDDKFVTAVGLGVGNSAAATTLGTVTKKMEVFDASGASLGFVAIYDAIT